MKKIFALLLLFSPILASAQDAASSEAAASTLASQAAKVDGTVDENGPWTTGGNASFTFNQVALKNWSSGGKNSIAGTFLFKTFANYKSEKATWDNLIDLGYGMTKYSHEDLVKTEDKILLSSNYGYNAAKNKLFYSALLDLKTQFDKGYNYGDDTIMISKFFAPAYISASVGMLYKPNDIFSLYLSPATGKITIVCDTTLSERYGLDAGDKGKMEYGAYMKIEVNKKNLIQNVDYYLRATAFSNLTDHPEHIDIDAETGFNFNVNKFLSALVKVNLLFDDDIKYVDDEGNEHGARLQVKELFGFSLTFNW